jgi:hypothetical protein
MAGLVDLREGLIAGARNMIGIGVATAAAGIIVATVTKTPIGTELAALVEQLSGGILIVMLVLIGLFSLILGMGLPTTANYIVVSSLMASVVVSLGAQEGLIVPLIAAHLFVFYFGIMADVTPPVGLASFAAAAVSGGDPIKTGFTAFFYSLRTVALPFLFIFNPALILYGVDLGTWQGLLQAGSVFVTATIAMLLFAAATQGYFLARSRIHESLALLLVAFTLFVPNVWLDMVQSPFRSVEPAQFEQVLGEVAEGYGAAADRQRPRYRRHRRDPRDHAEPLCRGRDRGRAAGQFGAAALSRRGCDPARRADVRVGDGRATWRFRLLCRCAGGACRGRGARGAPAGADLLHPGAVAAGAGDPAAKAAPDQTGLLKEQVRCSRHCCCPSTFRPRRAGNMRCPPP